MITPFPHGGSIHYSVPWKPGNRKTLETTPFTPLETNFRSPGPCSALYICLCSKDMFLHLISPSRPPEGT